MIKTRFAPSPTGYLHVGGLRTALYAYLFARKNGGQFILRIEDTDQNREVAGATENLMKTLEWFDLTYDEGPMLDGSTKGENGPYIQSQRTEIYREYVEKLLETGHAYRCFCTKERLDQMRENQKNMNQAPMYDRRCADLPESEIDAKIEAGEPFVIRQKIPYKDIKFKDIIRGNVKFHGKTIDDQILMKSDGFPTYHLANVVDDHLMEITHVIRGEEWLPSTPKHIALYEAFGWEPPQFAHVPLMLNPDKTKLSKRQGDVAAEDYINKGYIKEAIINFIVFIGWNPGQGEEREIFTLKELEEVFSLDKVHKGGAVFNLEKLLWFNWKWRQRNYEQAVENAVADGAAPLEAKGKLLYEMVAPHLNQEPTPELHKQLISVETKILRDPATVNEELSCYAPLTDYPKDLLTHEKMGVDLEQALSSIENSLNDIADLTDWTPESLKEKLVETIANLGIKNGQLLWPVRVALSGQKFSPGAFEMMWAMGKEESINRLNQAINKLK